MYRDVSGKVLVTEHPSGPDKLLTFPTPASLFLKAGLLSLSDAPVSWIWGMLSAPAHP